MGEITPGWKSTEFWKNLGMQAVLLLVAFRCIPAADQEMVTQLIVQGVIAVASIIGVVFKGWDYLRSRTALKQSLLIARTTR